MSTMPHKKVLIQGAFDFEQFKKFEKTILGSLKEYQKFFIEIESIGGNLGVLKKMSEVVTHISFDYEATFVAEIKNAESAALLFAMNLHEQHIIPSSSAKIHLPVAAKGVSVSISDLEKLRTSTTLFISERSNLSIEQVIEIENLTLGSKELLSYGIAKKLVPSFER